MEAVLKQKEAGLGNLPQRLLQILVKDPQPMMFHGEVVYQDGVSPPQFAAGCSPLFFSCLVHGVYQVVVGDIRAASYGHTLGGAVGLAMVLQTPHFDLS